jgi:hypothetical protein
MRLAVPFKGQLYYACEEPEHYENGEQGYFMAD